MYTRKKKKAPKTNWCSKFLIAIFFILISAYVGFAATQENWTQSDWSVQNGGAMFNSSSQDGSHSSEHQLVDFSSGITLNTVDSTVTHSTYNDFYGTKKGSVTNAVINVDGTIKLDIDLAGNGIVALDLSDGTGCPSGGWADPFCTIDTSIHGTAGVLEFASINIPSGKTLTATRSGTNNYLTLKVKGSVVVDGTLSVDGKNGVSPNGGAGGPGGFNGGKGGNAHNIALAGYGDGRGYGNYNRIGVSNNCRDGGAGSFGGLGGTGSLSDGIIYDNPNEGGSGGGGGCYNWNRWRGGGGGGGGYLKLLANNSISISASGRITSNGGRAGVSAGAGSGGRLYMVADTIVNNGLISANGGSTVYGGSLGGGGRIAIETSIGTVTGTGTVEANSANPTFLAGNSSPVISSYIPTYSVSGTFTSPIIDTGQKSLFSTSQITWTETIVGNENITMQIRAGNNTDTADASWTAYQSVSNGGNPTSALNGKRYVQYKTTLNASTDKTKTPTLNSVTVNYKHYPTGNLVKDTVANDTTFLANFDGTMNAGFSAGGTTGSIGTTGGNPTNTVLDGGKFGEAVLIEQGINLILNGSFEVGSSGDANSWLEAANHVMSSEKALFGAYSLKSTTTINSGSATNDYIPVLPNTQYTVSGYIYNSLTAGTAYLDFYDGVGQGGNFTDCTALSTLGNNAWERVECSVTTGATTTGVKVRAVASTNPSGHIYFDGIQLEKGSVATVFAGDSISEIDSTETGLVGLWHMNESSWNGTANEVIDSTGNYHSGKRIGNATTTTTSKFGNYAGTFDGIGGSVDVTDNSALDFAGTLPMTLSTWIKIEDADYVGTQQFIITNYYYVSASERSGYSLSIAGPVGNSAIYFVRNAGATTSIIGCRSNCPSLERGKWQLITVTYDGSYLTMYINGQYTSTIADTKSMLTYATPLRFGAYATGSGKFKGLMDEVAIYNRALSSDEVAGLYGKDVLKYNTSGNIVASSPGTIEMWVKAQGWSFADASKYVLFDLNDSANFDRILLQKNGTNIEFTMSEADNGTIDGTNDFTATFPASGLSDSEWHYISASWNGSASGVTSLILDANAAVLGVGSGRGYIDNIATNFYLGSEAGGLNQCNCLIDNVRISNTAHTKEKILEDYNAATLGYSLVSNPFNTAFSTAKITDIKWTETNVTDNVNDAVLQIRTVADNGSGLPGLSWSDWLGSYTNGSDGSLLNSNAINSANTDGANDQWLQYRVLLTSEGDVTPAVSNVKLFYKYPTTISSAKVLDLDGDGYSDVAKITFTGNISDATVLAGDFDVSGVTGETFFPGNSYAGDGANNTILHIEYTDGVLDSAQTPTIVFTQANLKDPADELVLSKTVTATDGVGPHLVSVLWSDQDDSTDISATDTISFTFNEAMDTDTVTAGNADSALPPGVKSYNAVSAVWSNSDKTVTIALGASATLISGISVNPANSVTDSSGNIDISSISREIVDNIGPKLLTILHTDIDGSTDISATDTLLLHFSEIVKDGVVTSSNLNDTVPAKVDALVRTYGASATAVWAGNKKDLTITLGTGTTIKTGDTVDPEATVVDLKDNADSTPTGVAINDLTNPKLTSLSWADDDGSGGISATDTLLFTFSEDMKRSTLTSANIDSVLPITGTGTTYGSPVLVDWGTPSGDDSVTITLGTGVDIISGDTVDPADALTDVALNADATTSSGDIVDTIRPKLLTIDWSDEDSSGFINGGDKLTFNFSEKMTTATIDNNSGANDVDTVLAPSAGNYGFSGALGAVTWSVNKKSATIMLGASPTVVSGATVNPTVAVKDETNLNNDNTLTPPAILDNKPPTLTSITWTDDNGSTDISVGDKLLFKFSEPLKTSTITTSTIDTDLPISGTGTTYGTSPVFVWAGNPTNRELTVTLGAGADIKTGDAVNPAATVTDIATIADNTASAIVITDTVSPAIASALSEDTDKDGYINRIVLTMSEALTSNNPTVAAFTVTDTNGSTLSVSSVSASGTSVIVALADNDGTTGQPTVAYVSGQAIEIQDFAGNVLANATPTVTDSAGPVLLSVSGGDVAGGLFNDNGDTMSLIFSERMTLPTKTQLETAIGFSGGATDGLNFPAIGSGSAPISLATKTVLNDTIKINFGAGNVASSNLIIPGTHKISVSATGLTDVNSFDAAINSAPISITSVDINPPSIASILTQDLNGNGIIDAVRVVFSERIKDSSVTVADFDVSGVTGEAFSSTTNSDISNDDDIYITFTENAQNSDVLPTVAYTRGDLVDYWGDQPLADVAATASTDGATAIASSSTSKDSDGDGYLDTIEITMNETLSSNSPTTSAFTVTDANSSVLTVSSVSSSGTKTTISLSDDRGTTGQPSVNYVSGGVAQIKDSAGNVMKSFSNTPTDNAGPAALSAKSYDTDNDGKLNNIVITMNEALTANSPTNAGFTVTDADGTTLTVSSVLATGTTVTITLDDSAGTTGTPTLTYVKGQALEVKDGSTAKNIMQNATISVTDKAKPVLLSASGGDVSGNGIFNEVDDTLTLVFSETITNTLSKTLLESSVQFTSDGGNFPVSGSGVNPFSYTTTNLVNDTIIVTQKTGNTNATGTATVSTHTVKGQSGATLADAFGNALNVSAAAKTITTKTVSITWLVRDSENNALLDQLSLEDSVYSQSGKTAQPSGITRVYNFGTYTTTWTRAEYQTTPVINWKATSTKSIDVYMASNASLAIPWNVKLKFNYDSAGSGNAYFTVWLEQNGKLIGDIQSEINKLALADGGVLGAKVQIMDGATILETMTDTTTSLAENGMFQMTWANILDDPQVIATGGMIDNKSYFIKVSVVYDSKTQTAAETFSVPGSGADYDVVVEPTYNDIKKSIKVNVWLTNSGNAVTRGLPADITSFSVYPDEAKLITKSFNPTTSIFEIEWDPDSGVIGSNKTYTVSASITYKGNIYSANKTFSRSDSLSEDQIGATVATQLAANNAAVATAVEDSLSTGTFKDDIADGISDNLESDFSNQTSTLQSFITAKTQDIALIKNNVLAILEDTDSVSETLATSNLESSTTTMSKMLNSDTNIKLGDTLSIKYQTDTGLTPLINVFNSSNSQLVVNKSMTAISNLGNVSIYEYSLTFETSWEVGNFTVSVSNGKGNLDSMTVKVVDSDIDTLQSSIDDLEDKVTAIDSGTGTMGMIASMSTQLDNLLSQMTSMESTINELEAKLEGEVDEAGNPVSIEDNAEIKAALTAMYETLISISQTISSSDDEAVSLINDLFELSEESADDIDYLRDKTQELQAIIEMNNNMLDSQVNKPTVRTWFEKE